MFNMKRVKFLDSIAGLGDPNKSRLEERYERLRVTLKQQKRSPAGIEEFINEQKIKDRYAEVPIGFAKDFSFKAGEEALIPAGIAEKWEACGICVAIPEKKAA